MQHSSEEEGLLLHFLDCVMTECVTMKINVPVRSLEVAGRVKRRKKGGEKKRRFVSTVVLQHTRQAITLERNEAFPAQNAKRFAHTQE